METVEYSHWLPYEAHIIYDFLTNPEALAAVVGRIVSARVVERQSDRGKLAVVLDLPARKQVETLGDVTGMPNQHLTFRTQEPFPLEFTWSFLPREKDGQMGTEVQSKLGFDLTAFGVPFVGLVLKSVITAELKEDMRRLEEQLAELKYRIG